MEPWQIVKLKMRPLTVSKLIERNHLNVFRGKESRKSRGCAITIMKEEKLVGGATYYGWERGFLTLS